MDGWAFGQKGTVFQTKTGGDLWNIRNLPLNTTVNAIYFFDKIGFILSNNNSLMRTQNEGTDWEPINLSDTPIEGRFRRANDLNLLKIECIGRSKECWVAGYDKTTGDGMIFYSSDFGKHWRKEYQATGKIFSLDMVSENEGWAVGENATLLRYANRKNSNWGVVERLKDRFKGISSAKIQ
jgi:photosystem II stability/assembly factor-like uncharacterized protein